MRSSQQQKFNFFLGFSTLMFFLRFARNNPEFLFFDGVLNSLFILYNYPFLRDKILSLKYLLITFLLFVFSLFLGPEGLSLKLPLITLAISWTMRQVFLKIFGREPEADFWVKSVIDKIYTLLLYLLSIATWITIVYNFMDHHLA
jgi:hypothetical protein